MAGGIAHDFNNILTSILGYCQLASLEIPTSHPASEFLRELRLNALRAKDLTSRILTFSHQHESKLEVIDLADPVHEATSLVRVSIPNSVDIISELEHVYVKVDSTQIHQVIVNLCTNSSHAIGEKSGGVRVQITRIADGPPSSLTAGNTDSGPWVLLEVSDTGEGMNEEQIERIFDPFFTTKGPGEGTGLGLSAVQGIITNHSGCIHVQSSVAKGTRMQIFLPESSESPPRPTAATRADLGHQREIMVVDDETVITHSLSRLLTRLDYRVTTFNRPHAALAAITQDPQRFDAIISDLTMPEIDGITLVQRIRPILPNLPVVFMSGFGQKHITRIRNEIPDAQFIAKPFERDAIAATLNRILPSLSPSSPPPGIHSSASISFIWCKLRWVG
ncbi:MAG: response regulator [Candidatus Synoicihabitans palmerolidicus]|nr:response regulator [Candidatus Synoicihabitans palmerolidicus]